MLVIFKSKAGADIMMFEENAKQILDLFGKETEKGIITSDETEAAIATLEKEIARRKQIEAEEKAERDCKVSRWLTSINVMVFVIRHYEKNNSSDWRIYAPLINTELFRKEMFADEKLMLYIEENPDGPYCMYGRNFAKTL